MSARVAQFLLCVALLTGAPGCTGYRLGPTGGYLAGAQSVQIMPFDNQTVEPRLSETFTTALRRSVQQDGTFALETRGEGDILLTAVITSFNRLGLSSQPRDVVTVLDYQLTVTARVKAVERSTGKVVLDRPVSGRTTFRVGDDLNSAERQTVPLLAADLARNITSLLVDGEW